MRYTDNELFKLDNESLNSFKSHLIFNEFCDWAKERLQYLIDESTNHLEWMDAEVNHLRNYRIKAIKFYEQKRGL